MIVKKLMYTQKVIISRKFRNGVTILLKARDEYQRVVINYIFFLELKSSTMFDFYGMACYIITDFFPPSSKVVQSAVSVESIRLPGDEIITQ